MGGGSTYKVETGTVNLTQGYGATKQIPTKLKEITGILLFSTDSSNGAMYSFFYEKRTDGTTTNLGISGWGTSRVWGLSALSISANILNLTFSSASNLSDFYPYGTFEYQLIGK